MMAPSGRKLTGASDILVVALLWCVGGWLRRVRGVMSEELEELGDGGVGFGEVWLALL